MNFDLRRIIPGNARRSTDALLFDDEDEREGNLPGVLIRAATSLALGLILWIYVASLTNPQSTGSYPNQVIEVRNVATNFRPTLSLSNVDVIVRASKSQMQNISSANVRTYVELSAYKQAGTFDVPLRVDVPPGASVEVKPATVQVRLDLLASKTVPLAARVTGTLDFGYTMKAVNISTDTITISGLAEKVDKVSSAVVEVNVERRNSTSSGDLTPIALDAQGNAVSGISFNPEKVRVTVPIELSLNYRTVPVKINIKGEPAAGYRIDSIKATPDTVTILGQPEVLSQTNFLDAEPVDVGGQTASMDTRTRLILGGGISLYNMPTNSVDVQVVIRQVQTTQVLPVIVTIVNASPNLEVVLTTRRLDLTLTGPLAALLAMQPTDVRAVLDLTGYTAGSYDITPTIILPTGIEAVNISPTRLPVTLLLTATPTLPPTTSPTPIARLTPATLPTAPLTPAAEPPSFIPPTIRPTPTLLPTASATP